jgi:hypothetical protein
VWPMRQAGHFMRKDLERGRWTFPKRHHLACRRERHRAAIQPRPQRALVYRLRSFAPRLNDDDNVVTTDAGRRIAHPTSRDSSKCCSNVQPFVPRSSVLNGDDAESHSPSNSSIAYFERFSGFSPDRWFAAETLRLIILSLVAFGNLVMLDRLQRHV